MTARHTKQNRFTGSAFIKQRTPRGGLSTVGPRDTIAMDACWCGRKTGHNWPGKNEGEPHPRDMEGTTVVTTHERLQVNDIKGFSKPIRDLLLEIVNDFKIRYRVIDGGHILLYPPDGTSRPMKISGSRNDKSNRMILEVQFMQEHGLRREKPKPTPPPTPEPKSGLITEEQPVTITTDRPVETPVTPESAVLDKVRAAIALLTESLGIESLETEALQALDEVDALRKQTVSLKSERDRYKSLAEAEHREAEKCSEERQRFENLLDEAVERADVAERKIATLKEMFS